ncbi:MAG TPA: TonB-dependent receptor [Rhodanobacteraceae bacterium]
MQYRYKKQVVGSRRFKRTLLAVAIGACVALSATPAALAQAITGTIRGSVPAAAGESVQVTGGAGFKRTIAVGTTGRYSITLPVGTYSVTLLRNGKRVQSRTGISPVAAGSVTVNFAPVKASGPQTLAAVNVTAASIPAIDVSTTNQVTTVTAAELQQLPLQRTAENIALLAPGVTGAAPSLGTGPLGTPLLSFGGASAVENAYYIDGMNTTNGLTGAGGVSLPYGAIEQEQVLTTGYGARYGRSIGGVINQIAKSGSNTWHFGARASWQPASLSADPVNQYWNNPLSTTAGQEQGDLRTYRAANSGMETIYDAHVSGPIVKDKLFFFLAGEQDNVSGASVGPVTAPLDDVTRAHKPKLFAKINWNIDANNILSVTGLANSFKQWGGEYAFDYGNLTRGALTGQDPTTKTAFRMWVANYTSYLTDNLTLHAMLGKLHGEYYTGYASDLPSISSASNENPAFTPNGPVVNPNTQQSVGDPAHRSTQMNYRVSLDYHWHNHDFQVGIDNMQTWDIDGGQLTSGPGYLWQYGRSDPAAPIQGTTPAAPPYVGPTGSVPNGAGGYYVSKVFGTNVTSVRVVQRAQYIQDNWQVTPNLLLNLGLRNDQFVNYSPTGAPYIKETKPQWAPRLGFSWNVFGDSTLKVFGNAGRYYLALPAITALSSTGAPVEVNQDFTYAGIDPVTGVPTGLTAIPENNGGRPEPGVSPNNEYGQPLDPRTVAAQNARAEFSDNFVLGVEKQFEFLHTRWVFGATGIYQKMSRILDDTADTTAICQAAIADGYANFAAGSGCANTAGFVQGSILINPGVTNTLLVNDPNGTSLDRVTYTAADQGFNRGPKRDYYALDLSLSHQWDGKWFARVDYTFARSYGNDEGPVDSITGQGGNSESLTATWDFPQVMQYSYGVLPNDQKHQLKVYGAYAINGEWTVAGNLFIASGHPVDCLGHFGPAQTDPLGYGNNYHWCAGAPSRPGSTGFTPWTHQLSLNVDYRPAWAQHKLAFDLAVFNVFNNQTPVFMLPQFGTTAAPDTEYRLVEGWTPPRAVRFAVSYNW